MRIGEIALVGQVETGEAEPPVSEDSSTAGAVQIAVLDEDPLTSEESDAAAADEAPDLTLDDAQSPPEGVAAAKFGEFPGNPPMETPSGTRPASGGRSFYDDDLSGNGDGEDFPENNLGGAITRLIRTGSLDEPGAGNGTELGSILAAIGKGNYSARAAGNRQPADENFQASNIEASSFEASNTEIDEPVDFVI